MTCSHLITISPHVNNLDLSQIPVAYLLEWIDATKHLTSVKHAAHSKQAWIKIISRATELTATQIQAAIANVSRETLRKGRIRLDCVAMHAFRLFFASLIAAGVAFNIYLFTDGSPQWRGVELYATSMDLVQKVGGVVSYERRLLPVLRVGAMVQTLRGKCFALLWKIFLVVGPYYQRLRFYCLRVKAIVSDMGTEKGLSWLPDLLPEFCHINRIPLPCNWQRTISLFPRALQSPDWSHMMDTVLKKGLSSLKWFPKFLDRIKAVVKFFREHADDISQDLKKQGLALVGSLIEHIRMPIFAKWRWGTLWAVCDKVKDIYGTVH